MGTSGQVGQAVIGWGVGLAEEGRGHREGRWDFARASSASVADGRWRCDPFNGSCLPLSSCSLSPVFITFPCHPPPSSSLPPCCPFCSLSSYSPSPSETAAAAPPSTSSSKMCSPSVLVVLLLPAAVSIYFLWTFLMLLVRQARSPLRHLPGPSSPSFFMGNLREMHDQENTGLVARWASSYGSTFVYRGFIGGCRLMTTDPLAVNYIMSHGYDYPKPDFVRDSLASMAAGYEGLLTAEGEMHRKQVREPVCMTACDSCLTCPLARMHVAEDIGECRFLRHRLFSSLPFPSIPFAPKSFVPPSIRTLGAVLKTRTRDRAAVAARGWSRRSGAGRDRLYIWQPTTTLAVRCGCRTPVLVVKVFIPSLHLQSLKKVEHSNVLVIP